jgi:hypothetical protein
MSVDDVRSAMKEWITAEARSRQARRALVDRWVSYCNGTEPGPSAEEEDAARALDVLATDLMQAALAKLDAQIATIDQIEQRRLDESSRPSSSRRSTR